MTGLIKDLTEHDYITAKTVVQVSKDCIQKERCKIDSLLDQIVECRKNIAQYENAILINTRTIKVYEVLEEMKRGLEV